MSLTDDTQHQLVQVKGVATTSASIVLDEGLVWRAFRNRREVGGFLGFAPRPYDSRGSVHAGSGSSPSRVSS